MKNPRDIIIEPIITEKSANMSMDGIKYVFKVVKNTNKVEVKKAIEAIFNVKVAKVNIVNVKPKAKKMGKYEGFKAGFKKAYITLADGSSIDFN
jgi:large subunit ribosomal protein L23